MSTRPAYNSPDFNDAAYELDLQSAVESVTADLHRACELEELVGEVRDAVPLLAWLAQQDIPRQHLSAFRALDRKARAIEKACDEYMERNA